MYVPFFRASADVSGPALTQMDRPCTVGVGWGTDLFVLYLTLKDTALLVKEPTEQMEFLMSCKGYTTPNKGLDTDTL